MIPLPSCLLSFIHSRDVGMKKKRKTFFRKTCPSHLCLSCCSSVASSFFFLFSLSLLPHLLLLLLLYPPPPLIPSSILHLLQKRILIHVTSLSQIIFSFASSSHKKVSPPFSFFYSFLPLHPESQVSVT